MSSEATDRSSKKLLRILLVFIGLILVVLTAAHLHLPKITDITVHYPLIGDTPAFSEHVPLPFFRRSPFSPGAKGQPLEFMVRMQVNYRKGQGSQFKFVPGQCVHQFKVNGQLFNSFDQQSFEKRRCDWAHGFLIDFASHLKEGENEIEISFSQPMSDYVHVDSLHVYPVIWDVDWYGKVLVLFFVGIFSLFFAVILRYWKVNWICIVSFIGAVLVIFNQLRTSAFWNLANDVIPHLEYVFYLVNQGSLPSTTHSAAAYHPPTFYLLASTLYRIVSSIQTIDPINAMRCISIFSFCFFLCFGLRVIPCYFNNIWLVRLASVIFIFWPRGLYAATCLTNEISGYAFFAAAFYYLTVWYQTYDCTLLKRLLVIIGAGLCVKTMIIVLIPTTAVLLFISIYQRKTTFAQLLSRKFITPVVILSLGFAVGFGRTIYSNYFAEVKQPLIVGSINWMPAHVYIENNPINYLYFDYQAFIKTTFISPVSAQYFANFFLKTSLFGEFLWYDTPISAILLSAALFLLICFIIFPTLFYTRAGLQQIFPCLLVALVLIGSIVCLTIRYPQSGCRDIRLIYPIVLCAAIIFAHNIEFLRKRDLPVLMILGVGIGIAFTVSSSFFILIQQLLNVS